MLGDWPTVSNNAVQTTFGLISSIKENINIPLHQIHKQGDLQDQDELSSFLYTPHLQKHTCKRLYKRCTGFRYKETAKAIS